MDRRQIEQIVLEQAEQVEALAIALCQIVSPTGHEQEKAAFVQRWLRDEAGIDSTIDAVGNVVVRIDGTPAAQTFLYLAHIDTVFGNLPSIEVRREGDKIIAPSIGDNSCSVAALMKLVQIVQRYNVRPRENLIIAFNVGEEGLGNLCGVRQLMKDYGEQIDAVISIDTSNLHVVDRAVGSYRYEIEVKTVGGHSWGSFGNPSAIYYASKLVTALHEMHVPRLPKTTFNVGVIEGGTSVNTIAQSCRMLLDLRSEDAQCLAEVDEQAMEIVRRAQCEQAQVTATRIGERPCGIAVDQRALLDRLRPIREELGLPMELCASSTDLNIPLSMGVPSLCFGAYIGHGAHTQQEYLLASSIADGLRQLLCFALGDA